MTTPTTKPDAWYELPGTPPAANWWWAVEHQGHPAFYLRALLAGDFRKDGPAPRHAVDLEGQPVPGDDRVHCSTCGEVPDPAHLEPIERASHERGFLEAQRRGVAPWPAPTNPQSCFLCSSPKMAATHARALGELVQSVTERLELVYLCRGCDAHYVRCLKANPGRPHLCTREEE